MKKTAFLIAVLASALLLAGCKSTKGPTFTNPILGGDYPDPTIMREGEDYYMTHSSFDYNPGLVVFHSRDLVNWEPISYALQTYLGPVWAPDISKVDGKYCIYFTVSGAGNFLVQADSPYGPWSDPVMVFRQGIDPCIAVAEDGTKWLFISNGGRVKLSEDGRESIPGTFEHVYDGWQYPSDWVTEGFCLEGPKLKKVGEWWYFLSAEGGTAGPPTSHMVTVARSKSLDGPWENSPYNPLIHTYNNTDRWWSRGHGSLIDTPDGRWYCVYHAYENSFTGLGRQTLLEPLELTEDGWFKAVVDDPAEPIALPLPAAPAVDRKAHLGEFRIGLDWKYYKTFDPARAKVSDGVLTLRAEGTCPGDSAPIMFVAGDHSYEFEVEIERDPGAIAGLVLYYDNLFYTGTGIGNSGTMRYRKDRGSVRSRIRNATHIWLRLRNDCQVVTAAYSLDGENWVQEEWGHEISGYNHNTCYYFQSVLPGLMAAGEGEVTFRNFKYREL